MKNSLLALDEWAVLIMKQFLSESGWAFLFVAFGVFTILVCHHFGIAAEVGAGIVGAGLNAFNNQIKQNQESK